MKTINVNEFTTRPVPLGRQGENEVTQVVIPVTDITTEFGNSGAFVLVVRRSGDTLIYPPGRVTWDDDTVTWTLTATDTAKSGRGKFGLRYAVGEKVKWSQIWESYVEPTLDMEQEDQPDVYTSFLEELSVRTAELHQDIEGITDEAKGYAEDAAASAASIELPLPITSGGTGQTTTAGAIAAFGLGGLSIETELHEGLSNGDTFTITYTEGQYLIFVENVTHSSANNVGPGLYLLGLKWNTSKGGVNSRPLAEIKSCYGMNVSTTAHGYNPLSVDVTFEMNLGGFSVQQADFRVTTVRLI